MIKDSIFNIKVKSKRRGKIISITSPNAFRNSIRELKKGYYSLGDYRALILAQNRARAILNKKGLSTKERKQFEEIIGINIPKP